MFGFGAEIVAVAQLDESPKDKAPKPEQSPAQASLKAQISKCIRNIAEAKLEDEGTLFGAHALSQLGKEALPEIFQNHQHQSVYVRRAIAELGTTLGKGGEEYRDTFRRFLKDSDPEVRRASCRALGVSGVVAEDAEHLLPLLLDSDPPVRILTLNCFHALGDKARPVLSEQLELVKGEDTALAIKATRTFVVLDTIAFKALGRDLIDAFVDRLSTENEDLGFQTQRALFFLGSDAHSDLENAANHTSPLVRARALEIFGQYRELTPKQKQLLLKGLEDSDSEVQASAVESLSFRLPGDLQIGKKVLSLFTSDTSLQVKILDSLPHFEVLEREFFTAIETARKQAPKNETVHYERALLLRGAQTMGQLQTVFDLLPHFSDPKDSKMIAQSVRQMSSRCSEWAPLFHGTLERRESRGAEFFALTALSRTGTAGKIATQTTIQSLKSPDPGIRLAAQEALVAYQDPQSLDPLLSLFTKDKERSTQQVAARTLQLLKGLNSSHREELIKLLQDKDPFLQEQSCKIIEYMGDQGRAALPHLVRTLADPNQDVMLAARSAVVTLREPLPEDLAELGRLLEHDNQDVRYNATYLLGNSEDLCNRPIISKPIFSKLRALRERDPDEYVRRAATTALKNLELRLGDTTELKRLSNLITQLNDDRFPVREQATADILSDYSEKALPTLLEELGNSSSEVRSRIAYILSEIPVSVEVILEKAQSEDRLVQNTAWRTLGRLNEKRLNHTFSDRPLVPFEETPKFTVLFSHVLNQLNSSHVIEIKKSEAALQQSVTKFERARKPDKKAYQSLEDEFQAHEELLQVATLDVLTEIIQSKNDEFGQYVEAWIRYREMGNGEQKMDEVKATVRGLALLNRDLTRRGFSEATRRFNIAHVRSETLLIEVPSLNHLERPNYPDPFPGELQAALQISYEDYLDDLTRHIASLSAKDLSQLRADQLTEGFTATPAINLDLCRQILDAYNEAKTTIHPDAPHIVTLRKLYQVGDTEKLRETLQSIQ